MSGRFPSLLFSQPQEQQAERDVKEENTTVLCKFTDTFIGIPFGLVACFCFSLLFLIVLQLSIRRVQHQACHVALSFYLIQPWNLEEPIPSLFISRHSRFPTSYQRRNSSFYPSLRLNSELVSVISAIFQGIFLSFFSFSPIDDSTSTSPLMQW